MPRKSEIEKEIIIFLKTKEEPLRLNDLYENISFSPQGIRNRIIKMEKKGLVQKVRREIDRKKVAYVSLVS